MATRLTGGTPDNVAIYENETFPDGIILSGAYSSFIELRNCIVKRDPASAPGPACDVRDGAHDILIKGGTYSGGRRDGDGRGGAIWIGIPNTTDFDVRMTVDGALCHDSEVAGINAEGNAYRGYYLSGLIIRNCQIWNIYGHPDEVSWTRTGVGIYIFTARDCLFENNVVWDCTMSCLHEDCDTDHKPPLYPCTRNLWRGNIAWNAAMSLLEFEGSVECDAHGNMFKGGAGWNWRTQQWEPKEGVGALCSWWANHNAITDNTFTDEMGKYNLGVVQEWTDPGNDAHDNVLEPNTFNIPFEPEEQVMAKLTVTIQPPPPDPVVVEKYVGIAQVTPGGPVEFQEQDAAGAKIQTLCTASQDPLTGAIKKA